MPGVLNLNIGIDAADPIESARVVLNAGRGGQDLTNRHGLRHHTQSGAVAGRHVVEIVGATQPSGAGHILHDDARSAGQVRSQMACDQATIEVVGSARLKARHDRDGFAAEVRRTVGTRRHAAHERERAQKKGDCQRQTTDAHRKLSRAEDLGLPPG